ncbi:hypothetical protein [Ruminococcus sp.]|uniref:hypothetical protein n=1 Tax=Ruminococcus sp. TaxID=41978 RepID=UPI002D0545A9|nr:hypothetical protein [Ruminococcus sp.]HNZ99343.1 hypothetical protein [Ruminococcus sp.]HOH86299.1 hypothetical protein [Ruminococcus sp.]
MKKKDVTFTIGLAILMGVIWGLGELVMGLWVAVIPSAHLFWFGLIVIITLSISVWHSMIEDKSDAKDPKRAKYERKVRKRRK